MNLQEIGVKIATDSAIVYIGKINQKHIRLEEIKSTALLEICDKEMKVDNCKLSIG